MLIIPAIDLLEGKCVRLRQGDYAQETVFNDDPAAVAKQWVDQGAEMLHLVDLDGAKAGQPINTAVIERIVRTSGAPCQLGGGLRTDEGISAALALGVERVIVGTQALRDRAWFEKVVAKWPDRVLLGVDARNGFVATSGWLDTSQVPVLEVVSWYEPLPLAGIVYTDIAKDGMMAGPNVEATAALAAATRHTVIASGGITTIEDVLALRRRGIDACILGRTIYEGVIQIPELLARLRSDDSVHSDGR